MGFELPSSGTGSTVEKVFQSMKIGNNGSGLGSDASPVDFDLGAMLDVKMTDKSKITLTLIESASGVKTPATSELRCKLVP